ncbi:unnamed protein product [marine sediment metagenome]|uniref:DNA methylase N-4/N-6 domain-containing protein n=1 Tax=marine sediment metagenome TaxID=412755 RepID=X1LWF3_9ZZZZ
MSKSQGKQILASGLYKRLSRLLKFFTAQVPGDRVLNFGADPAFGKYKQFFPDDAIAHPAKANASMVEWIILKYTKPGDVIVDPMSGTFSTCVIAAVNNRHGIGAELEDKFYKWGLEAKRRVERIPTLTQKGRMVVLKGDARELSKVLRENADAVVFSPPFAGAKQVIDTKFYAKALKDLEGRDVSKENAGLRTGEDSDENISNLPYGASAIIFSPPFAQSQVAADKKFLQN